MGLTPWLVDSLATLTVFMQGVAVLLIGVLLHVRFCRGWQRVPSRILSWISRHGLLLMFIVALTATSGSIFFSEIALWAPCKFCWIQRGFMYPQVLLLGLALWRRDRGIIPYILLLSLVGLSVSAFHYTEQVQAMLNPDAFDPQAPCDLSGISCRATYMLEYGYVTIPLMAGTAFVLNIIGSLSMLLCTRKKTA